MQAYIPQKLNSWVKFGVESEFKFEHTQILRLGRFFRKTSSTELISRSVLGVITRNFIFRLDDLKICFFGEKAQFFTEFNLP